LLIEHTFVTTLEGPEAIGLADSFLRAIGFAASDPLGALDSSAAQSLEMTRGTAPSIDPIYAWKSVRLDFDRGRVTVAASVRPIRRSTFRLSESLMSGREPSPSSKIGRPHGELMLALASELDALLAQGKSLADATRSWQAIEETTTRNIRNARSASLIKGSMIVAAFFVAVLCFIGFSSR
jgi:hypothetical protein